MISACLVATDLSATATVTVVHAFLNEELERYAQEKDNPLVEESKEKFPRIILLLNEICGESAFKKYQDEKFKGPMMVASFDSLPLIDF